MKRETGPTREPRTTTDNPELAFITYDQLTYPHHLTRAIHTSDFIYRGPALDTSLQAQTNSETHLSDLVAGKGIAGTFSPVFLNASGMTTEPDDIDVLMEAVHRDCMYPSPTIKHIHIHQVKLQDWVNRNLEGEHLDTAFWAPLARLLDHVRRDWMDGVGERSCYELTIRSVKCRGPKWAGAPHHFWHKEWSQSGPGQMQQPGPPSAATDYRHEPGSSGYVDIVPSIEGPNIYNTVDSNDPLVQHLPATSVPTPPTVSNPSGDADAPAGRYLPGSMTFNIPLRLKPAFTDGSRSEQFASDQLPSTPTPLTSPTASRSSTVGPTSPSSTLRPASPSSTVGAVSPSFTVRPASRSSTLRPASPSSTSRPASPSSTARPASPSSSMEVEPSIDEAGTHGAPAIRIVAPLAGLGTLFINEPSPEAAVERFLKGGTEPDVHAPKQGELAIWRVGRYEKEELPLFEAPSMATGDDRVFVSLVVGSEEQVRMRGSRL